MSKKYCFSSPFANIIEQFIELKVAAGYDCSWFNRCYKDLDIFALKEQLHKPEMTSEFVEKWRKTQINNSQSTIYQKISAWAMLARYMNRIGYNTFVPQLPKKEPKNFVPYIFTEEQINTLFNECDKWQLKANHIHSIIFAMPALFRVLYSTGLRISEALSIKKSHTFIFEMVIRKYTENSRIYSYRKLFLVSTFLIESLNCCYILELFTHNE